MALRLRSACCAAAAAALAVPGVADAAKKTVYMGSPPAAGKAFEKTGSDVNAFFPRAISVHTGDTVSFVPVGFHTIDFPPPGGKPLLFGATRGTTTTGVNDEAGVPFWFNGLPEITFAKQLLKANFGKTFAKGANRLTSGLPLSDKPKPFNVRFPKAGTYTYYCNIHNGMKGSVKVVGKTKPVGSVKLDALRVKNQTAAALKVAKGLVKATTAAANSVVIGPQGKGGVSHFGFVPEKLTVAAGTTVTFAMPVNSTDVHTASFGPSGTDEKSFEKSYLGTIAKTFEGIEFDSRGVYPSELPTAPPAELTPTLHGNGFWNSGVLDASAATLYPASNKVTFAAPGTYTYHCLIHTFMQGTITVQ